MKEYDLHELGRVMRKWLSTGEWKCKKIKRLKIYQKYFENTSLVYLAAWYHSSLSHYFLVQINFAMRSGALKGLIINCPARTVQIHSHSHYPESNK